MGELHSGRDRRGLWSRFYRNDAAIWTVTAKARQVKSNVVGFPKDRAELALDLSLQNLMLLLGHVQEVVPRYGQLAANEPDQSPVVVFNWLTERRGRYRRNRGLLAHDGSGLSFSTSRVLKPVSD